MPLFGSGTGTPVTLNASVNNAFAGAVTFNMLVEMFRESMDFDAWHFWQWSDSASATGLTGSPRIPLGANCDDLLRQHAYQSQGALTRDDIRSALMHAAQLMESHLGFSPIGRFVNRENLTLGQSRDGAQSFKTRLGGVTALGEETFSVWGSTPFVYTDDDGDGLIDTWTINVAIGDPNINVNTFVVLTHLASDDVTFPARDFDGEGAYRFAVPFIAYSVAAGQYEFKGRAWTNASRELYEGVYSKKSSPVGSGANDAGLNPYHVANYAPTAYLYRRYPDATKAIEFADKPCTCGCGAEEQCSCGSCTGAAIDDCRLGLHCVHGCSARAYVSYYSDWTCATSESPYAALFALAASLMKGRCCTRGQSDYDTMREDLTEFIGQTDRSSYTGLPIARTPFGTTRGALLAWDYVTRNKLSRGTVI
jgi:hypothetical protein